MGPSYKAAAHTGGGQQLMPRPLAIRDEGGGPVFLQGRRRHTVTELTPARGSPIRQQQREDTARAEPEPQGHGGKLAPQAASADRGQTGNPPNTQREKSEQQTSSQGHPATRVGDPSSSGRPSTPRKFAKVDRTAESSYSAVRRGEFPAQPSEDDTQAHGACVICWPGLRWLRGGVQYPLRSNRGGLAVRDLTKLRRRNRRAMKRGRPNRDHGRS